MQELGQMISTIGFPIVAFCLMYYMCYDTLAKFRDSIDGLTNMISKLYENIKDESKNE